MENNNDNLIRLLKTTSIEEDDKRLLFNSRNLFDYLINKKHTKIGKRNIVSDNKKFFIIIDDRLLCIDVKKDDEDFVFELNSSLYEVDINCLKNSKNFDVDFISQGLSFAGDIVSLCIFRASESQDGIVINPITEKTLFNANDMKDEFDLPKERYKYYKDFDENNIKKKNN